MGNFCTIFTEIQAEGKGEQIKERSKETTYLQKYELFNPNQIGKGSIADVYVVRDLKKRKLFALKKIQKDLFLEQNLPKKIKNEEDLMKQIVKNEFILDVHEFGEDERNFYIISNYCEKGDLFERLKRVKSFSEKQCAQIIHQVLSGLEYLHSQNIVHRDIKLENILISKENENCIQIKICDFTTARKFKEHKMMKSKIGTPYYAAPEIYEGFYNEKVDVWSCGVLAFCLLTGRPPYEGDSFSDVYAKIIRRKHRFDSDMWNTLSDCTKNFVKKLLESDPNKRYSSFEALKDTYFTNFL